MTFTWYKCYNNINYGNNILIDNIDVYITKLQYNKYDIINNKIEEIEQFYVKKIKDIQKLYNDNNEIELIKKSSEHNILTLELDIIKCLTKYTRENKNIDFNFLKECLLLILNFSNELSSRLKLNNIDITNKLNNANNLCISRCSYKFCNFKDKCLFYYTKNKKCYQDHYVHNMVSADIKILLYYINLINNENIIETTKEILKSINTISFVISHMESELNNILIYKNALMP